MARQINHPTLQGNVSHRIIHHMAVGYGAESVVVEKEVEKVSETVQPDPPPADIPSEQPDPSTPVRKRKSKVEE